MAETAVLHGSPLTPSGRATLLLLDAFITDKGYSPTLRELMFLMGLSSVSTMAWHLDILRRDGYVTWEEGRPRTLVITDAGRTEIKQAL